MKEEMKAGKAKKEKPKLEPIHMPKDSGIPFIMAVCWGIAGFGFTFAPTDLMFGDTKLTPFWIGMAVVGMIGVGLTMLARSFQYDTDYYIPVDEVKRTEAALGRDV
jgi:cytochrome aa3-600 menaquinol oxidase subunit 1